MKQRPQGVTGDPNQREMTGPYFSERDLKERWSGLLRWLRFPIMGREGGAGGRFLNLLASSTRLNMRKMAT